MKTFSDDDIIQSVKEGRTQYFEVLVERYKTKIINFINRMIYDPDEAQNIAQDVFLKVYTGIKKYRMEDNFQAFIFTVAKNLTLNYIKKSNRTIMFSSLFSSNPGGENFSVAADQETRHQEKEENTMLISALKKLNENQRLALVLKVYMDFSYKQIQEVTGWSVPKIETLISRAKSNLKNKILVQEKGRNDV